MRVAVPARVEALLEFRYGPTWRTPRYMDKGSDTGASGLCWGVLGWAGLVGAFVVTAAAKYGFWLAL